MVLFDTEITTDLAKYGFEIIPPPMSSSMTGKYLQLGAIKKVGQVLPLDALEAIEDILGYDFVGCLPVQHYYGENNTFLTFRKRPSSKYKRMAEDLCAFIDGLSEEEFYAFCDKHMKEH